MAIDARAFSKCVASLDSDVVDQFDVEEVEAAVDISVANICDYGEIDLEELKVLLKLAQTGCNGNEFVRLLEDATNLDLQSNERAQELSRLIIESFLLAIDVEVQT